MSNITEKVVKVDYQYRQWGHYPTINLFGENYIPLFEENSPIWKSHVDKLAKLILDSGNKYNLKASEKLDLGSGYAIEVKQVDVDDNKVWLQFTNNGLYVDDQIISTDTSNNTWTYTLNVQGVNNVPVLKVHVNQIFKGSDDSIAQIDGIWLIDYTNVITIKIGDKLRGYELRKIVNGYDDSNLGYLVFNNPSGNLFADFSTNTRGRAPLEVKFTDKSKGSPTSWNWDFGDGNCSSEMNHSTEQNPKHTYLFGGKYTVKLTVENSASSNEPDQKTKFHYITVLPLPDLIADFSAEPTEGKAPVTVKFTNKSKGCVEIWKWNFGEGVNIKIYNSEHLNANDPQLNPTYTYSVVGNYTVQLTVDSQDTQRLETKKVSIKVT